MSNKIKIKIPNVDDEDKIFVFTNTQYEFVMLCLRCVELSQLSPGVVHNDDHCIHAILMEAGV
jgi:hypothetical protein